MPLFMDIHINPDITADELKRVQIANPDLQKRYNIKYHHFWLNEDAGTLFLLIEGPDKESCARLHREVLGDVTCQIVEMEEDFFRMVMRDSVQTDHGLVRHRAETTETLLKFVVAVDIIDHARTEPATNFQKLMLPGQPGNLVRQIIAMYSGREIRRVEGDCIITVFAEASDAMACAVEIQSELLNKSEAFGSEVWNISFRIGISGGNAISGEDNILKEAAQRAVRLSLVAEKDMIVASDFVRKLSGIDDMLSNQSYVKGIHAKDEHFLEKLIGLTEENLSDSGFNLKQICLKFGISRTQLYRKITAITGRSPNQFIRRIKMKRALSMIRKSELNISEIALEVGYSNPSYFSRCFRGVYGVTPSRLKVG